MLQKLPVSKYVGTFLVVWGISLLFTAFAHNISELVASRAMLGLFESVTYPSMFLLIATLYRRFEQVIWFGIMLMSESVAGICGSLIGVDIMQMPTVNDMSPWKWTFIIFGSATSFIGFFYFLFLPEKPTSRWFRLKEEEKPIVEDRVSDNAVVPTLTANYNRIWEALKEPRFYCYALISLFLNLQNGALAIFSSVIIAEIGYSSTNTVLLNIPTGVMAFLLISLSTNISKKKGEIMWVAMITCTIALIGIICLAAVSSGGVKLIGLYLNSDGTATYVLLQTSILSNVSTLVAI